MSDTCSVCSRGREACEWCADLGRHDFEAICDCGLHDFGSHLTRCRDRDAFQYVIVANYDSADLLRTSDAKEEA